MDTFKEFFFKLQKFLTLKLQMWKQTANTGGHNVLCFYILKPCMHEYTQRSDERNNHAVQTSLHSGRIMRLRKDCSDEHSIKTVYI